VEIEKLATEAGAGGLLRRGVFAFGEGDAALLRDDADGLREAHVLNFADEAEDVPRCLAAEAVIELADGMDGKGGGLLFVKGTEAGVVLRAGLAEADVALDDLDDIGLLLDGLGEVGHGGCIEDKAAKQVPVWKTRRVAEKARSRQSGHCGPG